MQTHLNDPDKGPLFHQLDKKALRRNPAENTENEGPLRRNPGLENCRVTRTHKVSLYQWKKEMSDYSQNTTLAPGNWKSQSSNLNHLVEQAAETIEDELGVMVDVDALDILQVDLHGE